MADSNMNPYEPTLRERPAPWELDAERFNRRGGCYGFCLHMFYLGLAGPAVAVLVLLISTWLAQPDPVFSVTGLLFIYMLALTLVLIFALPVALLTYVACIIVARVFRVRSPAIWAMLMAAYGAGYGYWWSFPYLNHFQPLFLITGTIIGALCGLILAPHWSEPPTHVRDF